MISCARLMYCLLFFLTNSVSTLVASDLPDPWSDLRPSNAVRCLGALRAPLDAKPDDQQLLGLAIGAYVVLCLNADPESDGAFGPWLDRAHELVVRRQQARANAALTIVDEAAPELWVRLIDGDAIGVIAELDRLPADTTSPQTLALRALATTDWRPLRSSVNHHPLVDYARMVLFHRTKAMNVKINARDLDLIDRYVIQRSLWLTEHNVAEVKTLPGEAVAGIAWLLSSRQIDDTTANAAASRLLTALGAAFDPDVGRGQLIAQLQRHARSMAPDNAEAIAIAEEIALSYCDAEQGIMGADGKHLLVGLGDMAQWVRSRLCDAAYFSYVTVWFRISGWPDEKLFRRHDEAFGAKLRTVLPNAVATAYVSLGLTDAGFSEVDEPNSTKAPELLATAIANERARPHPLPDRQLSAIVAKLAKRRPDLAQSLVADMVARWPSEDGRYVRTGLQAILLAAWRCDVDVDVAGIARRAAERSPADAPLRGDAVRYDPNEPYLSWEGITPTTTWIAPAIDAQKSDLPQISNLDGDFAISWDGWLHITTAGHYEFAITSDRRCKAVIADVGFTQEDRLVFDNVQVAATVVHGRAFVSGWRPVRVDYDHRFKTTPAIRLLWKPPGATAFTTIPPAQFAHGDEHLPGLQARAVEAQRSPDNYARLTGVSPSEFAWAATVPWHAGVLATTAGQALSHQQYRQLIPLLRSAYAIDSGSVAAALVSCLLLQTGPELDEGLALLPRVVFVAGGIPQQRRLISHLRDHGRLAKFIPALQTDVIERIREYDYLRLISAVIFGDFANLQKTLNDRITLFVSLGKPNIRAMCLFQIALCRMYGQEIPDFWRLDQMGYNPRSPGYDAAREVLKGIIDHTVIAEFAPPDKDLVRWAEALLELCEGEHAKAQQHLHAIVQLADTDPAVMEPAKDLLAWYASQTTESLSAVPKAAPVTRKVTTIVKPGADDF